jgi:membrane protein
MSSSAPEVQSLDDRREKRHTGTAAHPRGWSGRAKAAWPLIKETAQQWSNDEAARQAASLALYSLLSLAPLLVLAIAVAGAVFGQEAARGEISRQFSAVVGPEAGKAVEAMVANAQTPSEGIVGSAVSIAVLLFGASGVFGELQTALNHMWNVKPKPGRGVKGFLHDRFFSFAMVMGVAFLLMVSLVVSAGLATLSGYYRGLIPLPALQEVLTTVVSLGVSTVLFGLIFKLVPDAKIAWRDVWVGGAVTAVLFNVGRILLAWYVGRGATASPFGAAGSLVALIVWVYYSAQILFMGAEFTQVYATRFGSHIEPAPNAERASESSDGDQRGFGASS